MNSDQKKEWVLAYLYNELSPEEIDSFQSSLNEDLELKQILEEEERLNRLYPVHSSSQITDSLLEETRRNYSQAIRKDSGERSTQTVIS